MGLEWGEKEIEWHWKEMRDVWSNGSFAKCAYLQSLRDTNSEIENVFKSPHFSQLFYRVGFAALAPVLYE